MLVNSVSFSGYGRSATDIEHRKLDVIANEFTSGSKEDMQLVTLAHDVFDIKPWYCSEGACFEKEDVKKANSFMDAMHKGFERGNKALAYALGKAVLYCPAGRADNGGFDDLEIGKLETLRSALCEESMYEDKETGLVETKPEYITINKRLDALI